MTSESSFQDQSASEIRPIELKNRFLALLLAWLFPGLGHLYQGRIGKGVLFAVCLIPLLVMGLWMGSYWERSDEGGAGRLNIAKTAYFSWRQGDKRLYFIPQAANAAIAFPALIQAARVSDGKEPFFDGAFAPPRLRSQHNSMPTANEVILALESWYDLGAIFLAVAGLLNILVMFDAFAGPAWILPTENRESTADGSEAVSR